MNGFIDRAKALARRQRLFVAIVLVPTLLSVLYFGFIASDVYISEARFVIRAPQRQATAGLGALLQSAGVTGFARATEDTYTVHDYTLSRDALKLLDETLKFRAAYSGAAIDRLSRFPALDLDDSFEALHRYYQKHVELSLDTTSGISTIRVRAYDPDLAQRINVGLLEAAERLVNRLNDRGREDLIRFANTEVAAAERRAKEAAVAVAQFRGDRGVVDPERQSANQLQQVSKLQDELIATRAQIAQVRTFTPDNPQLQSLVLKATTLQGSIDGEIAKVAGGKTSLSSKAADFQRLALEREFADRQLQSALVSLEQARNEAQRKQLYLERVVQPSRPDVAMEPRRLRAIVATLTLCLVAWGILTMLLAGIHEHQD
jgi:capsular polysaccharide transport system permease protein